MLQMTDKCMSTREGTHNRAERLCIAKIQGNYRCGLSIRRVCHTLEMNVPGTA
jgi:hypothetical protein